MAVLNGKEAIQALRRIEASSEAGTLTYFLFHGDVFSRRAGEADRHLFRVEGMLVRSTEDLVDPDRGSGFRRLGREMMVFRDPLDGTLLDQWRNPFTAETVEVIPVANDHVNGTYFERDRQGREFSLPLERIGPHWSYRQVLPIRRANPLAAGYEREIGGMYHAVELFSFSGAVSQLDDPGVTSLDVMVSWSRISDWFPWMAMEGREGLVYVHATGAKLAGADELPALLAGLIDTQFPAFREPPPPGDSSAMDTSWTEYKVIKETGRRWFLD